MKHVILTNPYAGNKNNLKKANIVKKLLLKQGVSSEIIVSEYPGYFFEIVKKLSSKSKCRFYCIGGDGTINEVTSALVDTDSEIVVIPYGTGNDFVKVISKYMSMRKIVLNSLNNKPIKADIMKFNKNKYSINILSVGFDAMVGNNVNRFRLVPFVSGKTKYNLSILYTLFFNKNFKLKIRCNDEILKGKFTLVAISNGKYYGGGVCPSKEADITDGILNICIVDETSLLTKLRLLPKYKKGKHIGLKQIRMLKSDKISIVSTKKFPINVDGEISYVNKLNIKVLPSAVNIIKI